MPGGFGTSNGHAVYFSVVLPLDPNPDPRYKPYFHLKNRHGQLFVIEVEAAQNPLEFFIKQRTGVSCATTQFRPSSSLRSSTSKSDENGSGKKNLKKKNRHQRKELDATKVSRGKLHGMK